MATTTTCRRFNLKNQTKNQQLTFKHTTTATRVETKTQHKTSTTITRTINLASLLLVVVALVVCITCCCLAQEQLQDDHDEYAFDEVQTAARNWRQGASNIKYAENEAENIDDQNLWQTSGPIKKLQEVVYSEKWVDSAPHHHSLQQSNLCASNPADCRAAEQHFNWTECASFLFKPKSNQIVCVRRSQSKGGLRATRHAGGSELAAAPTQQELDEHKTGGGHDEQDEQRLLMMDGSMNNKDKEVVQKLFDNYMGRTRVAAATKRPAQVERLARGGEEEYDDNNNKWQQAKLGSEEAIGTSGQLFGAHELTTRAWRQQPNGLARTYRLSYDEARRFLQAQQVLQQNEPRAGGDVVASAIEIARLRRPRGEQQVAAAAASMAKRRLHRSEAHLVNGAITQEAPVDYDGVRGMKENVVRQEIKLTTSKPRRLSYVIGARQSANQKRQETAAAAMIQGNDNEQVNDNNNNAAEQQLLKCQMRRFTFRASKSDEQGNKCSALLTANICYGGCDTGEIADWLFPYKKSIHKVCRHGRRVRKRAQLNECTGPDGVQLVVGGDNEQILANLQDYHYVDALDCVCKKCASIDTTCLGTMTRPHLQTLSETSAVANDQLDGPLSPLMASGDGAPSSSLLLTLNGDSAAGVVGGTD